MVTTDIISTAYSIINFVYQWHNDLKASQASVKQMVTTLGLVKTALEAIDATVHTNLDSPLRALVDCLNQTKELLTGNQKKMNKVMNFLFPAKVTSELVEIETRIHQLVSILTLAVSATHLKAAGASPATFKKEEQKKPQAMDFITNEEAKKFWESSFGGAEYSVAWATLEKALRAKYSEFVTAESVFDLQLNLDNLNTGYVSCHRLSDFCGTEPLTKRLQSYTNKTQVNAKAVDTSADEKKTPVGNSSAAQSAPECPASPVPAFPLLLWVDDTPANNEDEIAYAKAAGTNVVLLNGTAEAKQWLSDHPEILDVEDPTKLRIITDNAREGENTTLNINAGEDIIRYVRGKRCKAPVLVYCGNLEYTKYTSKYKEASATTTIAGCKKFIDELKRK